MKKLISIIIALAFTLSTVIAAPAGAVSQGTIEVTVADPRSGLDSDYLISFHNDGLLLGADNQFIDIMFPKGTVLPDTIVLQVWKSNIRDHAEELAPPATSIAVTPTRVSDGTVRIRLGPGQHIDKCEYVAILIEDVKNPGSCFHHLQVGTSVAGPFSSDEYTIYSLKLELDPGKNLISLPAYPEDTAIEVVLADLFVKKQLEANLAVPFEFSVWHWDAWEEEWIVYASDTSFGDLATMEAGKAYWIKVNKPVDFYFKGVPYPECQGPPQKWCYPKSWNMIGITGDATATMWASQFLRNATLGWPSQNQYAVSTIFGFASTPTLEPEGQFYDTGWFPGPITDSDWMENDPGLAPYVDVELKAGVGYFMSFLGEACIVPPVPGEAP